ncbi:MAG: indolepyruvate oxidoreductase subunit beta [Dehalococcoidia bacterium]
MKAKVDVLMAGVGGQGIILASDALAEVALRSGYDVKKSDSLGMAQRGGSVTSHVRLGEHVFSPMIKRGEADYLLAFERLEAARWADFLGPAGVAIVNDQAIPPLSVIGNASAYPSTQDVRKVIREHTKAVHFLSGLEIVEGLGNPQVLNVLLLGYLSTFLDIDETCYLEVISQRVPSRYLDVNLAAFHQGKKEALQGTQAGHRRESLRRHKV